MSGKHRARWWTPWQALLGALAYEAGIRGVPHRKPTEEVSRQLIMAFRGQS